MAYNPAMLPPELDAEEAAAILCELSQSRGEVAQPTRVTETAAAIAGPMLSWPSLMKGKRSRRDATVKERWLRFSPTSPLDLSGGSAASTSGSSSKVGYSGRQPLITRSLPPRSRSNGSQRSKKKMRRLPEVKEEVKSLVEENKSLKREAEELRVACMVLKKENCNLEARVDCPVNVDNNSDLKNQGQGFEFPDLNLPPPVDFC